MNSQRQKTILLVDDEVIIAMEKSEELEGMGYRVINVPSGEEAIRSVLDKKAAIELILMDINLGHGLDGTEAAEVILKEKDIPVGFLSSHTEPEIVEKTEKITSCSRARYAQDHWLPTTSFYLEVPNIPEEGEGRFYDDTECRF